MVKKLLTLTMGLALAAGASAQYGNYPYPASNIQFWTGSGANSAVVVISWDDENASYAAQGFAWGVHFNGSITAHNLLDSIAAYDTRFSFTFSNSLLSTIAYHDATNNVHLTPSIQYNCFTVNGTFALDVYDNISISNGDMMEISESCYFDCTDITPASDPNGGNGTLPDTVDAALPFGDILYWVGSGTDSAEFIVSYGQPDTAFAWGFLFTPGTTIQQMIDAIDAADPRFWVVGNPSMSGDLHFVTDSGDTLGLSPVDPAVGYNFWWTNLNGISVASLGTTLTNGDVFKYGDYNSATGWDYQYGYYMQEAWNTVPTPVSEPGTTTPVAEATIDASDILFWVGTGANQAILAVNWADTALAWGYRWDGSATVSDMMTAVATIDPRLSVDGTGFLNDILYIDTAAGMTDTLRITPGNYWESSNNGISDMGMGQTLANGDLEKWADPAAGIVVDSASYEYGGATYWYYINVYPMAITPVTVPDTAGHGGPVEPQHGPFCGAVGTEGCDAIAADSSIIVAWATTCSVERGPVDITDPDGPHVRFGTDAMGVGPATTSTTDAVSLGDGGSATLTFALPIANGDGPDFAVFENSYNDYFLELAFVEVSSDGQRFVRFPATSLTPTDVQVVNSVDPTNINNLAGKYRVGYGTPFDLDELRDSTGLDINNITHVRIVDVIGTIDPQYASRDAYGHIVNDPWPTNDTVYASGGFDLTGVAVMHQRTNGISDADAIEVTLWPNPANNILNINANGNATAVLTDINGRTVATIALHAGCTTVGIGHLPAGVYMLQAEGCVRKVVKL